MSPSPELRRILTELMPTGAAEEAIALLETHRCYFRLSPARSTKFGDFRAGRGPLRPTISVNRDLSPPMFLLTFLHELAHVQVWDMFKGRVDPHGVEWKNAYRQLTLPFVENGYFPVEARNPLIAHLIDAPATMGRNSELMKALGMGGKEHDGLRVRDLRKGDKFHIPGGRSFELGFKRRTRFLCTDLENRRQYLVHGETPVTRILTDHKLPESL